MKNTANIKVIKKKDLNTSQETKLDPAKAGQKTGRKMVGNVTGWVNEFQKRKRVETKQALDHLFPVQPQTDSA